MRPLESIAARSVLLLIFCGIDFCLLLGGYGAVRVLHLPVNRVTRLIGSAIITLSLGMCLGMVLSDLAPRWLGIGSKAVGVLSFLIAVYAASQWATRQWYVRFKRQISRGLIRSARDFLMFLRTHHLLFGWIVAAGAVGHMVFFLPSLARTSVYEEMTGFLAIGILAVMILLGLWLWFTTVVRRQRMPKAIHTVHAGLAIAFFLALFLHI